MWRRQESLRTLRALRTLVMSCEHLEAVMPVLDLSPLPALHHVILDHVYPQRCALPPGCTLDLRCMILPPHSSCSHWLQVLSGFVVHIDRQTSSEKTIYLCECKTARVPFRYRDVMAIDRAAGTLTEKGVSWGSARVCREPRGDVSVLNHNVCGEGWAGALGHLRAATCEWTSQYRTAWQLFRIDALPRLLDAVDAPLESLRLVGRGVSEPFATRNIDTPELLTPSSCEWTSQYRTAWQLFRIDALPRLVDAPDAPLESLRLVGRGVSEPFATLNKSLKALKSINPSR